jgi:hypothetical protein
MRKRWKLLAAGLALELLLVVGLAVAVLWPSPPSVAEREAMAIRAGMTPDQVKKAVDSLPDTGGRTIAVAGAIGEPSELSKWVYNDGSWLSFEYEREGDARRVRGIHVTRPSRNDPLTRLRRTLALAFPFLGK